MNTSMKENWDIMVDALERRHSEYALAPEWVASQEQVEEMLGKVLQTVPSFFNAQTVRMVLLTGESHKQHWELIEQELIRRMGLEAYNEKTREKIHTAFMSGVGTVLYFTEGKTVQALQEQMPTYADNFARWAREVQGSHQLMVWLGLTELGFGANLQHYIGMVDAKVRAQVGAPDSWEFVAQMPFGRVLQSATGKEKLPLSDTLKVMD